MKKLLVLGASYTQTPLYELSRKIGIKTVAMSIPGPYPGFELADETDMHNIADPDAVLRAARDHHVDGIVTCGLDLGMRAIGAAAEALGLPGPSKEAAAKAANKLLMKEALVAAGVQTAPFCCVHSEDELEGRPHGRPGHLPERHAGGGAEKLREDDVRDASGLLPRRGIH